MHFSSFGSHILNDAGHTAFRGFLAGTGVDGTNDGGIWATDPDGVLTLIVQEGDLFDIDDDPISEEFCTVA